MLLEPPVRTTPGSDTDWQQWWDTHCPEDRELVLLLEIDSRLIDTAIVQPYASLSLAVRTVLLQKAIPSSLAVAATFPTLPIPGLPPPPPTPRSVAFETLHPLVILLIWVLFGVVVVGGVFWLVL